jgi:hypothetical protein
LDTLALAHIQLGRPADGVQVVDEAQQAWQAWSQGPQPKFLETLVRAAEVYQAQGRPQDALDLLRRVRDAGYADAGTAKRANQLSRQLGQESSPAADAQSP